MTSLSRSLPRLLRTKGGEKVFVQERDARALAYIAKHRLVTEERLRERFWPADRGMNHFTRLRKLRRAGLIALVIGDGDARLGYRIEPDGMELLQALAISLPEPLGRQGFYKTSYAHDQLLQKVRDVLESSPLVSDFVDEVELRRRRGLRFGSVGTAAGSKVPDGLFRLATAEGERVVALELEIARKSWQRYRELVRRLATDRAIDATFFVVASPAVEELLEQAVADARSHDPAVRGATTYRRFYFVSLNELLEKRVCATFRGEGWSFSLASLAAAK